MFRQLNFTAATERKILAEIEKLNNIEMEVPASIIAIVKDVEKHGDAAVKKYTRKFDGVEAKALRVTPAEVKAAYNLVDERLFSPIKTAIKNIAGFHSLQKKNISDFVFNNNGYKITQKYLPLESAGIYIPGGQAPLFSTVLMAGIPALIAGVKRIALISPPRYNGDINPYILVAADLIGIKEIYRAGGAQGIAALAYGTKTIKKVDKICGPGNIYSTMAKKYIFGRAGIDSLNGPSEITIIADDSANAEFVSRDLLAQAEHVNGHAMLITTSKKLSAEIKRKIGNAEYSITAVIVKNMEQAVKLANFKAPEHLLISAKNPQKIIKGITSAPAIFIGNYTPVAFGDYMAGANHILPTNGTSRFFSGLSVLDFLKHTHIVEATREAMDKFGPDAEMLAEIETLVAHKKSMMARRKL